MWLSANFVHGFRKEFLRLHAFAAFPVCSDAAAPSGDCLHSELSFLKGMLFPVSDIKAYCSDSVADGVLCAHGFLPGTWFTASKQFAFVGGHPQRISR
jgi:hypothetical protein